MEAGISSKEAIKENHGIRWLTKKVYTKFESYLLLL
jgi:hypothetical protein